MLSTYGIGVQVKFVRSEVSLVLDLLTTEEDLATVDALEK